MRDQLLLEGSKQAKAEVKREVLDHRFLIGEERLLFLLVLLVVIGEMN